MFQSLFFLCGIIIGAFLNICIYRMPLNKNIAIHKSHCVSCGEKIKFYDLIPIISYIMLRGRCRHCKKKISIRYPFVELLNGILYLLVFNKFHFTSISIVLCIFFSVLIILTFIDFDYMLVPDILNILILVLAIISILLEYKSLPEHLIGAVAISVPMFIIAYLTKGFGLGDVFLYATAGLLLGYKLIILSFFIACIIATTVAIYLMLRKKKGRKSEIPFVPYISLGLILSALYGESIINWYLTTIII